MARISASTHLKTPPIQDLFLNLYHKKTITTTTIDYKNNILQ